MTRDEVVDVLHKCFGDNRRIQMYDCVGDCGDKKVVLADDGDVTVLFAPAWSYVEVLGLSDEDFQYVMERCGE